MNLREFNAAGIEAFRDFLENARQNPATPVPTELLTNDALTTEVQPTVDVEQRRFATRAGAAEYLATLLSSVDSGSAAKNGGLWTWIALFFFDQVCPAKNGRRDVKNDYRYIFEPDNPRHFYRHILFIAWRVITIAPTHNRLFLSGSVSSLDQVTAEVMKRLYLTRIPCIFEVLERLYWDEKRGRARAGIVTRAVVKPGDLIHRLPLRIRQLEMTYDLQSLTADKLIELLGDEFQRWKAPAVAAGS